MGLRGPKPRPTAVLKLTGAYRADRHGKHTEAQVPPGTPEAPAHLNAIARKEWDRLVHELVSVGLLTQLDRAVLAGYCASWSHWVESEKHIKAEGAVIVAPSGYPLQNPWLNIRNKALENIAKFAAVLGMSPSSRTRIDAKPGEGVVQTSAAISDYFSGAKA